MRRQTLLCLMIPVLLLPLGCNRGPERVPVRGKVTLDGGPWPAAGTIYFAPIEPAPGFPRRGGEAPFGADGRFEVTTVSPGDGLMPGKYGVAVECWKTPPTHDDQGEHPGTSHVPEKYQSAAQSGLQLTVDPGSKPIEVEYDIPRAE